jgi:hypothetical protein
MMGWMAPLRHLSAKLLIIESAATGSHPRVSLRRLDWTWRSMFFRSTGSMQRERRFCASSFGVRRFCVLQPAAALRGWDGARVHRAVLLGLTGSILGWPARKGDE